MRELLSLHEIVFDCADPCDVAKFWSEFIGGTLGADSGEHWARVTLPGGTALAFQRVEGYCPPDWPDGTPQQVHLDWTVTDIESAHWRAVELGATAMDPPTAPQRPVERGYRVCLDPAGHPFCLCRPTRESWN